MPAALSSALVFRPQTFAAGRPLYGVQSATQGLLRGWARYSSSPVLGCVAHRDADHEEFSGLLAGWGLGARPTTLLSLGDPGSWEGFGTVLRSSPRLGDLAWLRRFVDQRAFSLCGLTHTLSGMKPALALAELVTAPIQPWDAIVCTSSAARTIVLDLLEAYESYLAERIGSRPHVRPQLPVIPLGIHCDDFADRDPAERRRRVRARLGIAETDVAVLYHGRLSFFEKAHPVPMYLAVDRAAQRSGVRVHLIESGWTSDDEAEKEHADAAAAFPALRRLRVTREDADLQRDVWFGADVFVSLSDNVQETFGLTPVEAMASGLPVIVSDWDGYRETVRHGLDGFRIPTLIPPPGAGEVLAGLLPADDGENDAQVAGYAAMSTAIDVEACTDALVKLIADPALRARMGASGRQRARESYDWRSVIPRLDELFVELAALRAGAGESAAPAEGCPAAPLAADPFRRFASFATHVLRADDQLILGAGATPDLAARLGGLDIVSWGFEARLDEEQVAAIVARVREAGPLAVSSLADDINDLAALQRTIVHLIKLDVLRLSRIP